MQRFAGAEPLVGEVVGLRTFRVDESGLLLPLYSTLSWYDGPNTATCAPPTGDRGTSHPVPDPACECGFYAYGDIASASMHRQSRYVLAVVSCWGQVVAGTAGVRAQHARIDAVWLHPNGPRWVEQRVARRYPSARIYRDRPAMLADHPLSPLPCYEAGPVHRRRTPRLAAGALAASVLALGALPTSVLLRVTGLHVAWLAATVAVAAMAVWMLLGVRRLGHVAAALLGLGLLGWMVAPAFGLSGWVLRLPLLRGLVVSGAAYLWSLRPGFFPVDHAPRERTFCGVRA